MKPNRFDDLEAEWALFGKDWERTRVEWKALGKEQRQIKEDLQRWEGLTILLSLAILLLLYIALADRLWQ